MPRRHKVFLTTDAEDDLKDIVNYVEIHDSPEHSDYVNLQLQKSISLLQTMPSRGRIVPELEEIGVTEYREIFWRPYRIMYFLERNKVFVIAIFDGRRDLTDLLQRRLLRQTRSRKESR